MKYNQSFNGKLTKDELKRLQDALATEKQIRAISDFLEENKEYLSGFEDLVGDDLIPTKQFYFNMKHIGNLLNTDPDKVLNQIGIKLRGLTTAKLVRMLSENFMTSKQIFESRNELMGVNTYSEEITLPKEPVIWTPNHHFKDDALATVHAASRPVTLMFGSIPLYFNTTDGIISFLVGSILINRKNKKSKAAAIPKALKAMEYGSDLLWCPEGVHNKTPNELVLPLWNGVYKAAVESGAKVVPIVHYIFDPTQSIIPHEQNPIHTIVDDPIDLTKFSQKAGLDYLRDVLATWYYLMLEKYGKMSKDELRQSYNKRAIEYKADESDLQKRPLTSTEIGYIYALDYSSTVCGYDTTIEANADFRAKDIVRPEDVFQNIASIQNPTQVPAALYAKKLIRERKQEDFQRLF